MTPEEMARIVADPHLTNEAVRLILFVASHGDGEHEIEADELRMVLGCKGDTPVYAARQRAAGRGLLEWRQGGRNHPNVYRYVRPDTSSKSPEVSADTSSKSPEVNAPSVEVLIDIPPLVPPKHPLTVQAMQAIGTADQKLVGCRGALMDYLQARVPEERQYAYVQAVVAWIDNPLTAFRGPDGFPVPVEERTKLLAVALNEVNADGEGDRKYKAGNPTNLKTALDFVIKKTFGKAHQATGTDGYRSRAGPRAKAPPEEQDLGEGTTKFNGLNG